MISKPQAEATVSKAGLPPDEATAVLNHYSEAQIEALKRAVLAASLFALLALWFAGDLPGVPLGTGEAGPGPASGRRGRN